MAKSRGRNGKPRRKDKRIAQSGGRRKPCQHCKEKVEQVDYKDVDSLRRYISDRGKIRSRRITGACRRHQSQLAKAIKRARTLALLPYVNESGREEGRGGRSGGHGRRDA